VVQSTNIDTCVAVNHNKILSAPLLYSMCFSKHSAYNDRANNRFFFVDGNTYVSIDGTWVINTDICVGCKKRYLGVTNHFFISSVIRNFEFLDLTVVFLRIYAFWNVML